jgi:hypothetical protein
VELSVLKNDTILVLGKKGELLFNRYPFGLVRRGIKGFSFNRETEQLLIWTENKIGVLPLGQEFTPKQLMDKETPLRWVVTTASNIHQVCWVNRGGQILFTDQERVNLCDTNPSYPPVVTEVARIKRNSDIAYSDNSGRLFFLNANDGSLSCVQILPSPAGIISFPIPQEDQTP